MVIGMPTAPPVRPPPRPFRFSRRLAWPSAENAIAAAEARRRAHGDLVDLTETNPTAVGLLDDATAAAVGAALGRHASRYRPTARGALQARQAIAATYAAAGTPVDAERIVLTASSSESYGYLWKLLGDPGDAVLVPQPSYPLFDYLAQLEGVSTAPYRLTHDGTAADTWALDLGSVDAALAGCGARARALVVVSPNNPTGSVLRASALSALDQRASAAGLALLADEVFADYLTGSAGADTRDRLVRTLAAETTEALTFSLGGLSKSGGLPHLKLGWIVVGGPAAPAQAALRRLDLISDTYLSVGGPVQEALPELLPLGAAVRSGIAARVARNRRQLEALTGPRRPGSPLTLLAAEGGWSAIVRVPAVRSDEEWAIFLVGEHGVLVHPGYFFELVGATFLVLSLLPAPSTFDEGLARLVRATDSTVG
jgi:alanine-synthesizing transaminase